MKQVLEGVLRWLGPAQIARRRIGRRPLVLAYHNILPDDAPPGVDRSLHLPRRTFARQLELLLLTHEVVPLEALLRDGPGDGRRPRAAITFDDAYRGALTAGLAELAARDLPATVFVPPGRLGGRAFWWDALRRPSGAGLSERERSHALWELAGDDAAVRAWAPGAGFEAIQPPAHLLSVSERELATAMEYPRLTLGAHSWSHPNLAAVPPDRRDEELRRPLAWLRERHQRVLPLVAYPYGIASPAVTRAAQASGYSAGLLVTGAHLPLPVSQRFVLPRLNVPSGLSDNGFALRLAGLLTG